MSLHLQIIAIYVHTSTYNTLSGIIIRIPIELCTLYALHFMVACSVQQMITICLKGLHKKANPV